MSKPAFVPLNSKQHAKLSYSPQTDYSFTAEQTIVPLMNFEVIRAAECFPVIFPDAKSVVPYAMLGLGNRNIFVDDKGHWNAPYLPLMIANHPFALIEAHFTEASDKKSEIAIGIAEDAPHFTQDNGQRLFKEKGEATETLQHIREALMAQFRRHESLQPSLEELVSFTCLKESVLEVTCAGKTKSVGGLRCVDRKVIMSLPESTLGHLVQTGVMGILYAHWNSLRHLQRLLEDPSCPESVKNQE